LSKAFLIAVARTRVSRALIHSSLFIIIHYSSEFIQLYPFIKPDKSVQQWLCISVSSGCSCQLDNNFLGLGRILLSLAFF